MLRSVAILVPILLLCGCVQLRHYELGLPLTEADSPDPADGVSLSLVMEKLGPPLRLSAAGNGYVMAWEYWYITELKVGFSLGAAGAEFLSVDWGRADSEGDFLVMTFDKQHRLLSSHLEEWDSDAGSGQGVQPFVGVVDVVDVDDLLVALPAHNWGFNSMERLPTTLNRDSRPDTGQNGIEKRGTGRRMGQHTLELR